MNVIIPEDIEIHSAIEGILDSYPLEDLTLSRISMLLEANFVVPLKGRQERCIKEALESAISRYLVLAKSRNKTEIEAALGDNKDSNGQLKQKMKWNQATKNLDLTLDMQTKLSRKMTTSNLEVLEANLESWQANLQADRNGKNGNSNSNRNQEYETSTWWQKEKTDFARIQARKDATRLQIHENSLPINKYILSSSSSLGSNPSSDTSIDTVETEKNKHPFPSSMSNLTNDLYSNTTNNNTFSTKNENSQKKNMRNTKISSKEEYKKFLAERRRQSALQKTNSGDQLEHATKVGYVEKKNGNEKEDSLYPKKSSNQEKDEEIQDQETWQQIIGASENDIRSQPISKLIVNTIMSLKETHPIDLQDHVKDVFLIGLHSTTTAVCASNDSTNSSSTPLSLSSSSSSCSSIITVAPSTTPTPTTTTTNNNNYKNNNTFSSSNSLPYLNFTLDTDLIQSKKSSTSSSYITTWISNGMFPITITIQFDAILCLSEIQLHGLGIGQVEISCINKENDIVYSCEIEEESEKTQLRHGFPEVFCSSLTLTILNSTCGKNPQSNRRNQFVVLKKIMCFGKGLNIFSGESR